MEREVEMPPKKLILKTGPRQTRTLLDELNHLKIIIVNV
jgi:hypothetical protein